MKKRTPNPARAGRATGLALVFALLVSTARADWRIEAETGALYESNLSNSDRAADAKDDFAWQSALQIGNALQLNRDMRLNLGLDLREQVWARFDAFNHLAPGGSAGLRYRFGLGRTAPWLLVEDHVAYSFFKEDGRSGIENRFRVRGGFGLTSRLALEAAYTMDDFAARDRFWDLTGNSGSIRLTFAATSSLQLGLGYSYRAGQVISYALPPRPDIVGLTADLESVNSFGSPPYTAYHLRGNSHTLSASVGYSLGQHLSIQINYEFRQTSSGPLDYDNHLVEAKFAFVY